MQEELEAKELKKACKNTPTCLLKFEISGQEPRFTERSVSLACMAR
jgi:hypothetical protein